MKSKNKLINDLFGEKLTSSMFSLLEQFYTIDFNDDEIYKSLMGFNESFRTGMYLLALEHNLDKIAYRINRANKKINIVRQENFIKAYEEGKAEEYLKTLGKADKISLLSDLGVDVPVSERIKLSNRKYDYYKIISNSVMLDQTDDNRDGLTTFLEYKKDKNET